MEIRRKRRGFFGQIIKWTFIVFEGLMIWWFIDALTRLSALNQTLHTSAERAGAAIGTSMGLSLVLMVWLVGTTLLGFLVFMTRGEQVIVDNRPATQDLNVERREPTL